MKRPNGVTIIAVLTFFGAAILATAAVAFFVVAVMGMTGEEAGDPASVAIAGMGVAGGFSLLVLAGIAACLAIGVLELCEWARVLCIASITAGIGCTILSLIAFGRNAVMAIGPSITCHLLVIATAVWMLAYLSRSRVKLAFADVTA